MRSNRGDAISSIDFTCACCVAAYSAVMRNPNSPEDPEQCDDPYASALPRLFDDHPATSPIGIHVRQGDAQLRLRQLEDAEAMIRQQEVLNAAITDRIERMRADHDLNMDYLLRFGVTASERAVFREVLKAVAQDGGLSLREAAQLAHARRLANAAE